MKDKKKQAGYLSAREKFLGLSLESSRKSYYPQLQEQLEAARENERRLQLLIDNLPARVSYVDLQERYVLVNRECEKAFGLEHEEIVGACKRTILGEANYEKAKPFIDRALAGERVHFETAFSRPDETDQWLEVSYVPDIGAQGEVEGFYELVLDQTEKRRNREDKARLEKKLQESQKFEAIGTLAGGIAHDFNNLLMGIQGHASLMAFEDSSRCGVMDHVRAIEEHVRSASDLTRQLLGFARGGKYEVKPTDLSALVDESATMFGRTKKQIAIHRKLPSTPVVVEVDRRQIEQVLLNMFVNSWQAMPDGGSVYLEINTLHLDELSCAPYEMTPGQYARITVTDTGIGMTREVRARVFDPFYTTKDKQRGTGLGLASAYGIVKNHGGIITVYSEPGQGATFNIYLPLSPKKGEACEERAEVLLSGSETILLVDDEQMIVDVGSAMLDKLGYRVHVATSGRDAVEFVAERENALDLIILDMVMPDLDGGRTFDEIHRLRPDIPVILSSGYSFNGQAERIIKRGCRGFIQKPFSVYELSVQIRAALQECGTDR